MALRHAACSVLAMANDPLSTTCRLTQSTIAFHEQPTMAIGPNDLARALFREQTASTTFRGSMARSGGWEHPTLVAARVAPPGRLRAFLVCFTCLVLGVGAGHAVREGRAYAGTMSRGAATPREPRTVLGAAVGPRTHVPRGKAPEPTASRPAARPARARTTGATRAAATKLTPASEADALFADLEPTFRVGR